MKECPCKDCNKRHATCHGECKDYLEWSENNDVAKTVIVFIPKERRRKQ